MAKASESAERYLSGFGNEFATEAAAGALPIGRNSPQQVPLGLYAEQISGTPFTAPRGELRRSWLYRIRPTASHPPYRRRDDGLLRSGPFAEVETPPNRLRWDPLPLPGKPSDFVDGLVTMGGNGDPAAGAGIAIHAYLANRSMTDRVFYDADGELLIVPQQGRLRLVTELGVLAVAPGEIAVVPRGLRFRVDLLDSAARGYICENHGAVLRLPELGPIGSNGLANPRDFLTPVAWFEDAERQVEVVQKFMGHLWASEIRGTANVDFVIFPPRWMVAEDTFRPPWFHRNVMNEFLSLVHGVYDAKAGGFLPGGASLHNCMSGHGPDVASYEKAVAAELKPHKIANVLAFMFETRWVIRPTRFALETTALQKDYDACWQGFAKNFRRRS